MNIIERQVNLGPVSPKELGCTIEYFMGKYGILMQHVFYNPSEKYEEVWDVIDDDYGMHHKAMIVKVNETGRDISIVEMVQD
jgi:hypothetical protein